MKPIPKHPKQQRMEDMTFPLHKPRIVMTKAGYKKLYEEAIKNSTYGSIEYADLAYEYDRIFRKGNEYEARVCFRNTRNPIEKDKVIWEGREWLRSINDPNHERRMVGVMCLVLAVLYALAVYVLI